MLLLVSCMSTRNHLLYFARFCAGSTPKIAKQKHTTKNFAKFPDHFPQLTIKKRKGRTLLVKATPSRKELNVT